MKGAVKYIVKSTPLIFILENVRGFATKHKKVKKQLLRKLKQSGKYILHEKILNSRSFGGIQNRERWYCVGYHKEFAYDANFDFKWPVGRGPKFVAHVLGTKFDDVPVTSFNNTIQRNWGLVEGLLDSKRWCDHKGPWIADLMQSPSHGPYVSAAVPTITKSHAPCNAYWLVVVDAASESEKDSKPEPGKKRKYKKRPLTVKDVLLAQGWTATAATTKFKDIPEKALLAALGNGMSFNVMKSLWSSLKPLLNYLNQNDIDVTAA